MSEYYRVEKKREFTDVEKTKMSRHIAIMTNEVENLEEAKKTQASEITAQVKQKKDEIRVLAHKVVMGFEVTSHDCTIQHDADRDLWICRDAFTREEVARYETLPEGWKQPDLPE